MQDIKNAERGATAKQKKEGEKKYRELQDLIAGREKEGKKPAKVGLEAKREKLLAQIDKIQAEYGATLGDADQSGVNPIPTEAKTPAPAPAMAAAAPAPSATKETPDDGKKRSLPPNARRRATTRAVRVSPARSDWEKAFCARANRSTRGRS